MGLMSERTVPRYTNIQFWDPSRQEERALRVFFYSTLPDRQNRILDMRLHEQMTHYLSLICGEVITLNAFNEPTQMRIVENTMLSLLDEWRIDRRISPASLFDPLPFLDVDMVIFMERTAYEQIWKKYDKMLVIGLNVVALELDLGEPIFAERFLLEIPWTGESTSYMQAEKQALLHAADALSRQFAHVANMINQIRLRELQAEYMRIREEEREAEERARMEQRRAGELLRNAERVLRQEQAPPDVLNGLRAKVEAIAPLTGRRDLTPEQSQLRRQLSAEIEQMLERIETAPVTRIDRPDAPSALFERVPPHEREPIPPSLFGEMTREAPPVDIAPSPIDSVSPVESPIPSVDWLRDAPAGVDLPDEGASFAPAPSVTGERTQTMPSLNPSLDDPFNRSWLMPRGANSVQSAT